MTDLKRLGDYQFAPKDPKSLLGRGGFSKVYRARQVSLDRTVALKILNRSELEHPAEVTDELVTRFENEARILGQIQHPNIVAVYQFGCEQDLFYLAMEHVPGENLTEHLSRAIREREGLGIAEAVRIGTEIVSALKAAFEMTGQDGRRRGIIHRDVKPTNILIDPKGQVKIADFGLARLVRGTGATTRHRDESDNDRVTRFGSEVGTPLYMSPEAFSGLVHADHRSDIYSLGVVLYELLTNAPPFEGSWEELRMKHNGLLPDDPRKFKSEIPERLVKLVFKCLAKRPQDRYQTYQEIERELGIVREELQSPHPAISTPPSPEPAPRPKNGSKKLAAISVVALCLAIAAAGAYWHSLSTPDSMSGDLPTRATEDLHDARSKSAENEKQLAHSPEPQEKALKSTPIEKNSGSVESESKPPSIIPPAPAPQELKQSSATPYLPAHLFATATHGLARSTALIFEHLWARSQAEQIIARRSEDIANRRFDRVVSELETLLERVKADSVLKRTIEFELEPFRIASRQVQKFLEAIDASVGKETTILCIDGTSVMGTVQSSDADKIVLDSGLSSRTVKLSDVHPRRFGGGAGPLEEGLFLHADRQSVHSISIISAIAKDNALLSYFLPRIAEHAVAQAHASLKERGSFDLAKQIKNILDPKTIRLLTRDASRKLDLILRELDALAAFEAKNDETVARNFQGTIAFGRTAERLLTKAMADEAGGFKRAEYDELEHWQSFGPPGNPNPVMDSEAGQVYFEQPQGISWAKHRRLDWSRGFDLSFSASACQKSAAIALLVSHVDSPQKQIVLDLDRKEIVFLETAPTGKDEDRIFTRRALQDVDRTFRIVAIAAYDLVFIFVDSKLLAWGTNQELSLAKDIKIGVRHAKLRVRDLKLPAGK